MLNWKHTNAVKDVRRKGRWQWAAHWVPNVRGLSIQNSQLRSVTMICMEVVAERRDTEDKVACFSRRKEGTRRKGMEKQCEDSYRHEEMILRMTYREWWLWHRTQTKVMAEWGGEFVSWVKTIAGVGEDLRINGVARGRSDVPYRPRMGALEWVRCDGKAQLQWVVDLTELQGPGQEWKLEGRPAINPWVTFQLKLS